MGDEPIKRLYKIEVSKLIRNQECREEWYPSQDEGQGRGKAGESENQLGLNRYSSVRNVRETERGNRSKKGTAKQRQGSKDSAACEEPASGITGWRIKSEAVSDRRKGRWERLNIH